MQRGVGGCFGVMEMWQHVVNVCQNALKWVPFTSCKLYLNTVDLKNIDVQDPPESNCQILWVEA